MTATMQPGLTKPSEITEPGWYWAEELMDDEPDVPDKYILALLRVERDANRQVEFVHTTDGFSLDTAAADNWFRIIRRIDEPEITGGWA